MTEDQGDDSLRMHAPELGTRAIKPDLPPEPVGLIARLRPATEDDVAGIVTMATMFADVAPFKDYMTVFGTREAAELRFAERARQLIHQADSCLYVVQRADSLIGMAGGIVGGHPLFGATTFFEVMWWVEPMFRVGRTGALLAMALESEARMADCELLMMSAPNEVVVGLLTKLGYHAVETVMVKRLKGA